MADQAITQERGAAPRRIDRKPGDVVLGASLIKRIGSGHCATVWQAADKSGEHVAVKIFEAPKGDWAAAHTAFMRGIQTMERLSAEGISLPKAIAKIRSSSGAAVVTDFAERGNIVDLPALQWPPRKVARFFKELCEAIGFAHENGVFHGCLKPENILLSEDFEPVVTDFDMVDLPLPGDGGGYSSYAAPETLEGKRPESPLADIYSLGRIFYFLLLGEEPTEEVQDFPELLPLTGQPVGLIRIIRKCTTRDPANRYKDVPSLLADLARYDDAGEVGIASDSDVFPSRRSFTGMEDIESELGPRSRRISQPDGMPASRRISMTGDEVAPASLRGGDKTPMSRRGAAVAPVVPQSEPASGIERVVALVGAVVVLASLIVLFAVPVPEQSLLGSLQASSAIGAAMITVGSRRHRAHPIIGRAVFAIAVGGLVYIADIGHLSLIRLRATLASDNASARAGAVKTLADNGHRIFDRQNLSSLDLKGADLTMSSFIGADLTGADLSNAALMESIFDSANFTAARIQGANFTLAELDQAQGIETAECDRFTKFPEGWACVNGHPARRGARTEEPPSGAASTESTGAEPQATTEPAGAEPNASAEPSPTAAPEETSDPAEPEEQAP